MVDYSLAGIIRDLIKKETVNLRHYIGSVVTTIDPENKGRILVTIDERGWDTPDKGLWCYPRQTKAFVTPKIGDYVEVYFMGGDPGRAVWLGIAAEMAGMIPSKNQNLPTNQILFQSNTDQTYVKCDELLNALTLQSLFINLGDGATEPAVLGQALLTWITNFITVTFNTHVHGGVLPGGATTAIPTPVGVAPTTILSTVVKVK